MPVRKVERSMVFFGDGYTAGLYGQGVQRGCGGEVNGLGQRAAARRFGRSGLGSLRGGARATVSVVSVDAIARNM